MERPAEALDYGAFQHPPSPLFRAYLTGADTMRPFFEQEGRWDLDALGASAERTLAFPRRRGELAESLARQQEARGSERAAAQARRLAEQRASAVVTGQQAGLFGGPLYVLYKAAAALELAARLERERGAPVVAVFWVASDDHDFAEVRETTVLDESGQIRALRYTPEREPMGWPASRIVLDRTIGGLIEELGRVLPDGLHRDDLLARLAESYAPGATLSGAFARFLSSLLPELVVLDASEAAVKVQMAPVMAREMAERSPTSRLAAEVGEKLHQAGYHQQVAVRPGFLNLFLVVENQRRPLAYSDSEIEIRGLGRRLPLAEAARRLAEDPSVFSPGVLLRPLAQDHVLPTAAYVGGPAEIAYHAQIGPAYGHFGIPRPALVPRPSFTLVEPAQARALEAEGLTLPDLQTDPEALATRWAREAYPDLEAAFARTRETLEREMGAVEVALAALDPTLRGAADAARGRALHQIETLHQKSFRALKKREQARADRLRRTRDALLPGGLLQERGLGLISILARRGPAVVDEIRQRMDPFARGHQVIYL
ncbi:MAG TPA: bacillithiol biosynthesis cysteine-adding enzyme BshC [Vicinamibacteria bacterium]|nr:bacillithiol biosynthesis cysteine-adding enzyme BshC [Vicinamibacteria bacterium]